MTPPVTTEALVEALAQHLAEAHVRGTDREDDFDWSAVTDQAFRASFIRAARRIFGGPLAPLLAAHQQVTAERDEYAEALMKVAEVGGWQASAGLAAEVRSALARLRAEGEAKDRALKLCLAELDWQVSAAEHCGDPDRECPMQDIGKPCGEHAQARDAARAATAREG